MPLHATSAFLTASREEPLSAEPEDQTLTVGQEEQITTDPIAGPEEEIHTTDIEEQTLFADPEVFLTVSQRESYWY